MARLIGAACLKHDLFRIRTLRERRGRRHPRKRPAILGRAAPSVIGKRRVMQLLVCYGHARLRAASERRGDCVMSEAGTDPIRDYLARSRDAVEAAIADPHFVATIASIADPVGS